LRPIRGSTPRILISSSSSALLTFSDNIRPGEDDSWIVLALSQCSSSVIWHLMAAVNGPVMAVIRGHYRVEKGGPEVDTIPNVNM
jgi:hypothetical protein